LILDFEYDQHLESHKHLINIIMGFRDMGCYMSHSLEHDTWVVPHGRKTQATKAVGGELQAPKADGFT
jgi:hypothetical protein